MKYYSLATMIRLKDTKIQTCPSFKSEQQAEDRSFYLKEYDNIPMIEVSHDINFVPNLSRIKAAKRVDIDRGGLVHMGVGR